LLKRDGATRQREEWHLDIFQAKEVEVYNVPQEKGKKTSTNGSYPQQSKHE